MSPRSKFSDKIDVPLYNGNFYIFGKLCGIMRWGKFRDTNKKIAPKVLF